MLQLHSHSSRSYPERPARFVTPLLPGYGPVISVNHPVRTRMPGGVGAGGEKPPATRLFLLTQLFEPQQGGWTKRVKYPAWEPSGIGFVALKLLAEVAYLIYCQQTLNPIEVQSRN